MFSVALKEPEIIIPTGPDAVSTIAKWVAAVLPAVQAGNCNRFEFVNGDAVPVQELAFGTAMRAYPV